MRQFIPILLWDLVKLEIDSLWDMVKLKPDSYWVRLGWASLVLTVGIQAYFGLNLETQHKSVAQTMSYFHVNLNEAHKSRTSPLIMINDHPQSTPHLTMLNI